MQRWGIHREPRSWDVVLSLKFLIANKQTIAAEIPGILTGTAGLNESRYFRDALTLKWKSNNVLRWERGILWKQKAIDFFQVNKNQV